MKKDLRNVFIGVALGLLAAWLLGVFRSASTPSAEPAAKTADTPAQPAPGTPAVKVAQPPTVALPTMSPVKASQSATTSTPAQAAAIVAAAQSAESKQMQVKAVLNNLRQISGAAQQYMLAMGVSSVNYYQLVGDSTDNLLHNVTPVMGEDYSGLYLEQSTTQLIVVAPDGTTVTFTQ